MIVHTRRFILRDFEEEDRFAFVAYQMDPRYRQLYDLDASYEAQASELFSLFLRWQTEEPRQNYQLGIFDKDGDRLSGSAGLRKERGSSDIAVLGIELSPDNWGRYRAALEIAEALIDVGFEQLDLECIVGDTASGNRRIEKLARWFGAELSDQRPGPDWMTKRGWVEVDWSLSRSRWRERRAGRL